MQNATHLAGDDMDRARRSNKSIDLAQKERFVELADRTPRSTADAEFIYSQILREDAKDSYRGTTMGFYEFHANRPELNRAINHYQEQYDYVNLHIGQEYPVDSGVAVNHREMIDRCFYYDTVEEIMQALKNERHPFAKQCLTQMKKNSMTSMKLALRMLRNANNMDYEQCLKMELNVAFNKIQDADFDLGVAKILMSPKPKGAKGHADPGFEKKINDRDLDRYFEPTKWSKEVNVNIVENSLLPTRHFFRRFNDSVRLWLNEESTTRDVQRDSLNREAKESLLVFGIDVRDKALT
jgi:hypothetical protein